MGAEIIIFGILAVLSLVIGVVENQNTRIQSESDIKQLQEHNKELSELEYQQNLEQWNRENEYNLPENQMQRFEEAGLNPNLIYGQSSTSAASPKLSYNQSSALPQITPRLDFTAVSGLLNTLINYQNSQQQLVLQKEALEQASAKQAFEQTLQTAQFEQQQELFSIKKEQEEIARDSARLQYERDFLSSSYDQQRLDYEMQDIQNKLNQAGLEKEQLELKNALLEFEKEMQGKRFTLEEMLTNARIANAVQDYYNKAEELYQRQELFPYQKEAARLSNNNAKLDVNSKIEDNRHRKAANQQEESLYWWDSLGKKVGVIHEAVKTKNDFTEPFRDMVGKLLQALLKR